MKPNLVPTVVLLAAACFAVPGTTSAQGAGPRGTDVLHWFVRDTMSRPDGETNAVGRVEGRHNQQGRADQQRLEIFARNLETNGTYHLLAALGDDTNWTYIAPLTSDKAGALALRYRYSGTGNGHLGRPFTALPDLLKPASNVRGIVLANANTQAVLVADLTMPDFHQYLIKRGLDNDGLEPNAQGVLRLRANLNQGTLRLQAWNLIAGTNYLVALNGEAAQTANTDTRGRLNVSMTGFDPLDVLNLRSVAVWNSESNSVLSTTLP